MSTTPTPSPATRRLVPRWGKVVIGTLAGLTLTVAALDGLTADATPDEPAQASAPGNVKAAEDRMVTITYNSRNPLLEEMSKYQILAHGQSICDRYDAATGDTNVAFELFMDHMTGGRPLPGISSVGAEGDEAVSTLLGAAVRTLCPEYLDAAKRETEQLDDLLNSNSREN